MLACVRRTLSLRPSNMQDPFHTLLNLPWGRFLCFFFLTYTVEFLIFALLFYVQARLTATPRPALQLRKEAPGRLSGNVQTAHRGKAPSASRLPYPTATRGVGRRRLLGPHILPLPEPNAVKPLCHQHGRQVCSRAVDEQPDSLHARLRLHSAKPGVCPHQPDGHAAGKHPELGSRMRRSRISARPPAQLTACAALVACPPGRSLRQASSTSSCEQQHAGPHASPCRLHDLTAVTAACIEDRRGSSA